MAKAAFEGTPPLAGSAHVSNPGVSRLGDSDESAEKFGKLTPLATAILSCVLFLAAAFSMFPRRHFYDDETINATFVRHDTLPQIFHRAETTDVHPPLQYVFNWLTYHAFGSLNSILWVNALLVAGSISFFVWGFARKAENWQSRVVLAVAVGLNPSLLLWCVSLRWYAYWVPISMAVVTLLYLRPRTKSTLWWVAGLSVLNFFVGYLTILFSVSIFLVEVILRRTKLSARIFWTGLGALLLIAPQIYIFWGVHYPQSRDQTSHQILTLIEHAISGSVLGPGIFPESPIALLTIGAVGLGAILALASAWKGSGRTFRDYLGSVDPEIGLVAVLLALELMSGIAVKERNLAIVQVVLWAWLAVRIGTVRIGSVRLGSVSSIATWGFVGLWFVGVFIGLWHIVNSRDTGKPSVNLPIYEVLNEIRQDAKQRGIPLSDVYLVTWNNPMALHSDLAGLHLVTPFTRDADHYNKLRYEMFLPKGKMTVLIKSGQQAWTGDTWASALRMDSQVRNVLSDKKDLNFGLDKYADKERKLLKIFVPDYQMAYESGISTADLHIEWIGKW